MEAVVLDPLDVVERGGAQLRGVAERGADVDLLALVLGAAEELAGRRRRLVVDAGAAALVVVVLPGRLEREVEQRRGRPVEVELQLVALDRLQVEAADEALEKQDVVRVGAFVAEQEVRVAIEVRVLEAAASPSTIVFLYSRKSLVSSISS